MNSLAQVTLGCLNQHMIVIGHQHIGVNSNPESFRQDAQQVKKMSPVMIVVKYRPPINAPGRHMIPAIRYHHSKGSRHARTLPVFLSLVNPYV